MTGLMKTNSSSVAAALARRVEHEQPVGQIDLVGRQPDPLGGVHQIEHLADDLPQLGVDAAKVLGFASQGGVRVLDDLHEYLLLKKGKPITIIDFGLELPKGITRYPTIFGMTRQPWDGGTSLGGSSARQ